MSLCNPCQAAGSLPACLDTLTVGKISSTSANVYVYIKNHTTDAAPVRFSTTSDEDGYIDLDLGTWEPMPNHSYELWVTLRTAKNQDCKEDIQPADCDSPYITTAYSCFALKFEYIDDDALERVYYTSATITVE